VVAGGGRGALVTQSSGVRAEAWVWLGGGTPRWIYNAEYRPPLTPQEKRATAPSSIVTHLTPRSNRVRQEACG